MNHCFARRSKRNFGISSAHSEVDPSTSSSSWASTAVRAPRIDNLTLADAVLGYCARRRVSPRAQFTARRRPKKHREQHALHRRSAPNL